MYDLKLLREAATAACVEAFNMSPRFGEAINWGDLSCRSAEHFTDDHGRSGYRVWIEEAAPEVLKLRMFIHARLKAVGFDGVEVFTEW